MAIRKIKDLLLSGVILLSFFPLIINTSNFLPELTQRNLQYVEFSSSGIYYLLEYQKNDITGTGDKLQDVPYKALCVIKACENSCCTGDINNMKCGTAEECKTYFDSTRRGHVAAAVIIPIAVTVIFFAVFFILWKKNNVSWDLSALLAFISMFVITIPFVIWYLMKYKPFDENSSYKKSEENHLYKGGKDVEFKIDHDKIILSDNKKIADTERFSGNNYNKLSADDDSNKNINIISISNKNEKKTQNIPDNVFDENLRDDQASNHSYNKQKSNNDISQDKERNNSVPHEDENNKDNNENNEHNNENNDDNNENDNLEISQHSEAKSTKSEHNASRYSRQESNANGSIKSANKSRNESETPEGENNGNVSVKEQEEGNNYNDNNEHSLDKEEKQEEPNEGENDDSDAHNNEESKENAEENQEGGDQEENENNQVSPVEDA